MNEQRGLANIGQRWSGWARIIGTAVALAALLGLGTVFYNEVWQSRVLTYTILPTYDLGNQFFTGLVIENRGRVTLTNVQIILSGLDAPMNIDPYMPGPHEPAELVSGGAGQREALIEMPRLSKGGSLSVYILTSGTAELVEGKSFLVNSEETPGVASSQGAEFTAVEIAGVLVAGIVIVATWITDRSERRRDIERLRAYLRQAGSAVDE